MEDSDDDSEKEKNSASRYCHFDEWSGIDYTVRAKDRNWRGVKSAVSIYSILSSQEGRFRSVKVL